MMSMKISSIMNTAGFTERATVTGVSGDAVMEDLLLFGSFRRNAVKAFAEESVSGGKPMPRLSLF